MESPMHRLWVENYYAAAVNLNDSTASVYFVDKSTGALTEVASSPFATGSGVNEIAFSPVASGDLFAAAVNFASNNISVYKVHHDTGFFTEVAGSPFATGGAPDGIAFTPLLSGNLFACTGNYNDNTVSVFQVTVAPLPPLSFTGIIKHNRSGAEFPCKLEAQWEASPTADVIFYRIYQNGVEVKKVLATEPFEFSPSLATCEADGYEIKAIDSNFTESRALPLTILSD